MDLMGLDEDIYSMVLWYIMLIFLFTAFFKFNLAAGLIVSAVYIFVTWMWLEWLWVIQNLKEIKQKSITIKDGLNWMQFIMSKDQIANQLEMIE